MNPRPQFDFFDLRLSPGGCRCQYNSAVACENPPDPSTGEGLLCLTCAENPDHMAATMVPKRLPPHSNVQGET